jgi:hypothetical protein
MQFWTDVFASPDLRSTFTKTSVTCFNFNSPVIAALISPNMKIAFSFRIIVTVARMNDVLAI